MDLSPKIKDYNSLRAGADRRNAELEYLSVAKALVVQINQGNRFKKLFLWNSENEYGIESKNSCFLNGF